MQAVTHLPISASSDFHTFARHWWHILLRGMAAIAFGVVAFIWPGVTLMALIWIFGAYVLVDGVISVIGATMSDRSSFARWWLLIIGMLSIAAGILAFTLPATTGLVLLVLIACWAIAIGISEIVEAIRLRKDIDHGWILMLSGVVSVIFGAVLLTRPGSSAVAIAWLIGTYAIISGALHIAFALRLRTIGHRIR